MDAVYYIDAASKTDPMLARGVITGVISAYMSLGMSFQSAVDLVISSVAERNADKHRTSTYKISLALLPESWVADFAKSCTKHRVPTTK